MMRCQANYQPYPIYTTVLTGRCLPPTAGYRPKVPRGVLDILDAGPRQESGKAAMKQRIIQTMFRESEAQTEPFVTDVVEGEDSGLEILTLGWLSWNHGLPAGMNEIKTIERARQKRAWESALPVPFDQETREIRTMLVQAMELNEWNYREEVIGAMVSLRMELAEKAMKERREGEKEKYEARVSEYARAKKEEKNKKIQKLRHNFCREIRKLTFRRQKVNPKFHRWNIVKQFADKTSELYAPQMRFGDDPRHWHETINPLCGYWEVFKKLEVLYHTIADIPEPLKPAFDFQLKSKPRHHHKELCIRLTKWTNENLEKLHEELRNIRRRRRIPQKACHLKKKVVVLESDSEPPRVKGVPDEVEDMFQACLFLQKTIKGRAIQAVMFEGRVKCQELIEELKSTHALQKNKEDVKAQLRRRVFRLQRQEEIEQIHEKRKKEILAALEGKTTGHMLDFLAKELQRLQDERMTHAMALAADQERHKREAAEAGRRQLEEKRRREHDEMFKQIMKIYQNTVQAFLEDVMIDSRDWVAHREAREYVSDMAQKIDQAARQTAIMPIFTRAADLVEEEVVADLIHNFALPEVEKRLVRERLQERQKNYLRICHDEVYSNIERIVEGTRNMDGELLPLPLQGKHKIPPIVRVKYLRLKRMHDSSSSDFSSPNSADSLLNQQFAERVTSLRQQRHQQRQQQHAEGHLSQEDSHKDAWSSGFSRQGIILETNENHSDRTND